MTMNKSNAEGFSLVELLVVIAIIGILAAIAVPSYRQYIIESSRSEGAGLLMEVMARQESAYRSRLTYTTSLSEIGYTADTVQSENALYLVTAEACADGRALTRCVTLRAAAQGSQATDGDLTLTSNGAQTGNWP